MDNKELLNLARNENNKENYENDVMKKGNYLATRIGILVIALFSVVEYFITNVFNFGYFAIWFVVEASLYAYKAVKVKEKVDIFRAILFTALAILFTVLFILRLTEVI